MFHRHFQFLTKRKFVLLMALFATSVLVACQIGNQIEIPPADKLTIPAIGTPISGSAPLATIKLPTEGIGGVLLINKTDLTIRVAVSNTITTIPAEQGFLFVLPPGIHQFYIYDLDVTPELHIEQIDEGRIRYLYLMPPPR